MGIMQRLPVEISLFKAEGSEVEFRKVMLEEIDGLSK